LDHFLRAFTSAARDGARPLDLTTPAGDAVRLAHPRVDFGTWSTIDAVRAGLLIGRFALLGDAAGDDAARASWEAGDAAEQESWLRSAPLLPQPARYSALVIDACRTNILPVFRAVATGNPYAADHFPVGQFNQLVLKALFNGVPLAGIVGLPERRNPELARMAGDYAREREAAGRVVPHDIGLAL
jgi:hypothetical protein